MNGRFLEVLTVTVRPAESVLVIRAMFADSLLDMDVGALPRNTKYGTCLFGMRVF